MRFSVLALFACGLLCFADPHRASSDKVEAFSLDGQRIEPFAQRVAASVFLFVRTDCPITNRYAPELERIAREFAGAKVRFWLVYPDRTETSDAIKKQVNDYQLPGTALRDPQHRLVGFAHAAVAPEAAVFDTGGRLQYHGRIDDRYVEVGKARASAQVHDLEDAIRDVLAGKPVRQAETRAVGCSLADIE